MHLNDRVALVTGASSGLGAASAHLLAQHGAAVGCLSHESDALHAVVDRIVGQGGQAMVLAADVSEPDQMQLAVAQLVERFGRLDIVFANAGINGVWAPLDDLTPAEWDQTLSVNLTGTFLTLKYTAPYLRRQGGSVIVCSSVNGTRMFSNTGATAYAASKAGQVAVAKMLAVELAADKVRVNVICPGAFESEIGDNTEQRDLETVRVPVEYPAGEIPLTGTQPGRPEEVGKLVVFLASDDSRHITGTEIWIDGAQSLLQG